jgi:glycerophosphoryl diester phosphodiesterase
MKRIGISLWAAAGLIAAVLITPAAADSDGKADRYLEDASGRGRQSVQVGPRPFYLVANMDDSALKANLASCGKGPFRRTDFSIGHRGAALQFPEHTRESYEAAARMGAGIVECDVTFTRDGELVCRHAECDLHTTTNIVATPLNAQCSVPYTGPGSSPQCCASDLTLDEFKSLTGKMDASNPAASDAAGYLGGTADWRTDLYTGRGTLLTLRESIELNRQLGVKHTPELKSGDADRIATVFGGQAQYAQRLIDELRAGGVKPADARPQSFNLDDVLYWIANEPAYGRQAVYLVDYDPTTGQTVPPLPPAELKRIKALGVRIVAPPIPALLAVENGRVVPSELARTLKRLDFDIITWSFERSDLRRGASKAGFYYAFDPAGEAIRKDSDMYLALDVLARRVGVLGIFSDWPGTVTYYANCMGL